MAVQNEPLKKLNCTPKVLANQNEIIILPPCTYLRNDCVCTCVCVYNLGSCIREQCVQPLTQGAIVQVLLKGRHKDGVVLVLLLQDIGIGACLVGTLCFGAA